MATVYFAFQITVKSIPKTNKYNAIKVEFFAERNGEDFDSARTQV